MAPAATRLALALLLAALAAVAACSGGSDARGEGSANVAGCGDGADSDGDGAIDCADSDCAGRTCRAAVGGCDDPEVCTAGACPDDALSPGGKVCRARASAEDACDAEELCDGVSPACPDVVVMPAGTPCRAECVSGYCVDGICCASACTGTCRACNVRYYEGTCQPLVSEDPANECGRYLCGGSACYGYCVTGAAGGDCGERYCDSGSYCKDERCVARPPNGTMCLSKCQCASNRCILFFCM
jgi:hypothetical protein